jgi:ABC-type antimicrobial peptide transport system permease subunit
MNGLTLKALIANSKRSLHVVVAVALSVGLVFSSFTIAEGVMGKMYKMAEGYTVTNLFYVVESTSSVQVSHVGPWVLELVPDGVDASPLLKTNVELTGQGIGIDVWGAEKDEFMKVRNPWVKGSWPSDVDEVMVGVELSERLGVLEGSILMCRVRGELVNLVVTGVFRTGSQFDQGLLAPMNLVQGLIDDFEGFSMIELRVNDFEVFHNAIGSIEDSGVRVLPSKGVEDYLKGLGEEVRLDLFIVSGVVDFLVLIFVARTLYKVLSDCSDEIIILRMIGVTRIDLAKTVLTDSVILTAIGSMLGLVLGLLMANILAVAVYLLLGNSYIVLSFDVVIACYCFLSSILVGLIGGMFSVLFNRPLGKSYGSGGLI